MSFKQQHTFTNRKKDSLRIRMKYPGMIPIICERKITGSYGVNILPEIDKKKFLVPSDLTVGSFIMIIRKRMKLRSEYAIFLIFNDRLFSSTDFFSNIYENCKDEDGFLYCIYSQENTFGCSL